MTVSVGRRPSTVDAGRLLEWYEQMALIRQTEKAAYDLFMSGEVKGTTHLAVGPRGRCGRCECGLARGRLCVRDLPRTPPCDRPRCHAGRVPGGADEQGHRLCAAPRAAPCT